MSDDSKTVDNGNGETASESRPDRDRLGKWKKGSKGGPGVPKKIHAAPLFDGDEETQLLTGIPPKAIEPKPKKEPDQEPPPAGDLQEIAIPDALRPLLERDKLVDIYEALARKAAGGKASTSAASELFKLIDRYKREAGEAGVVDDASAYAGLPQEIADLCRELDCGLSELLHRHALGLPLADIEFVIVETANAVRLHGPLSPEASRWSGVAIAAIGDQNQKG